MHALRAPIRRAWSATRAQCHRTRYSPIPAAMATVAQTASDQCTLEVRFVQMWEAMRPVWQAGCPGQTTEEYAL